MVRHRINPQGNKFMTIIDPPVAMSLTGSLEFGQYLYDVIISTSL